MTARGRRRVLALAQFVGDLPIVGRIARTIYRRCLSSSGDDGLMTGSERYWNQRYRSGGHSGEGSFGKLAAFKAQVVNDFVRESDITSIIEFGCGDGNQLKLASYPTYLGFDVSRAAVDKCRGLFQTNRSMSFRLMSEYADERADLGLSLDVIYHLVEDRVFEQYMRRLFESSERYVVIYSSNTEERQEGQSPHVRHRAFTKWIEENLPEWILQRHIPNRYPYRGDLREGTIADFFIYGRVNRTGGSERR